MKEKIDLLAVLGLRRFQMLFGIFVLGLSVTLVKGHYASHGILNYSGVPLILPLSAAIGVFTFSVAILNLAIMWTNFLRDYIEMVIETIVIVANMVVGTVCLM